jgi:hypothetical protein
LRVQLAGWDFLSRLSVRVPLLVRRLVISVMSDQFVSGVDSGLDWDWIDLITTEYGSAEAPRRAMTTDGPG